MLAACEQNGVQLTFNHQRRFNQPFRKAKELLKSGAIGDLQRIEATCDNMMDWGTHWFDMAFFFNDETPVEWVIGQIEGRGSKKILVAVRWQGISQFQFKNGVMGLLITGANVKPRWASGSMARKGHRIGHSEDTPLRMLVKGQGWTKVETSEGIHGLDKVALGVLDLVDALKTAANQN